MGRNKAAGGAAAKCGTGERGDSWAAMCHKVMPTGLVHCGLPSTLPAGDDDDDTCSSMSRLLGVPHTRRVALLVDLEKWGAAVPALLSWDKSINSKRRKHGRYGLATNDDDDALVGVVNGVSLALRSTDRKMAAGEAVR